MLRNYLLIAFRNLVRHQTFSLLNIVGLAIGLTSCLYILLYVQDELSYDRFHANKDRIYRICQRFRTGDGFESTAQSPDKIAREVMAHMPGVEKITRIDVDFPSRYRLEYGDQRFLEEAVAAVDSNFFDVFSFPMLEGDPKTALIEPYTVVMSEQTARKYFSPGNAVGKMVRMVSPYSKTAFEAKVTGVFRDMPANSHFHKKVLVSAATADIMYPNRLDEWGWTSHYSYLLLSPNADAQQLEKALPGLTEKYFSKEYARDNSFFLQSLTDIHLRSKVKDELEAGGDIAYVYIFSAIALIIVLLACINYMNLATARAANRAKEVGIRKVIGARKTHLVYQFLGESMLITFLALALSLLLAAMGLPLFNALSGKQLGMDWLDARWMAGLTILSLLIALLAGSYPAFFLSTFQPVKVLKGALTKTGSHTLLLRKGLVVLQFGISIVLLIGTVVIYTQWHYLQEQKLGINSEQVLTIPVQSKAIALQYPRLRQELKQHPGVVNVTTAHKKFTERPANYTGFKSNGKEYIIPLGIVGYDFFNTFDIPVIAGRDFSPALAADTVSSFVINEAAAKLLGLSSPVGHPLDIWGLKDARIIGVVKDFHFESLHAPISPTLFLVRFDRINTISVKIRGNQLRETVAAIEATFKQADPQSDFHYTFLDEDIGNLYRSEAQFLRVFTTFSALAIFTACLGIFGLASFTATQRTKEIGIRKVLGASVRQITLLLTKDFIQLVALSNLIAWPLAFWMMHGWLESFPYRISVAWWMFAGAGILALLIALFTVSFQAIRAALANPVKSLRTE